MRGTVLSILLAVSHEIPQPFEADAVISTERTGKPSLRLVQESTQGSGPDEW